MYVPRALELRIPNNVQIVMRHRTDKETFRGQCGSFITGLVNGVYGQEE